MLQSLDNCAKVSEEDRRSNGSGWFRKWHRVYSHSEEEQLLSSFTDMLYMVKCFKVIDRSGQFQTGAGDVVDKVEDLVF
jgi:hypothetical protein